MKKAIVSLMLVVSLCFPYFASADKEDGNICTLDEFIERYNEGMTALEYEELYGIDPSLNKKNLTIEPGEVNDTLNFAIDNDQNNGFCILMLNKGSENINGLFCIMPYRGDNKQPVWTLEYATATIYGSGLISDVNDITEAMYEMGLYSKDCFALGKTGSYKGNGLLAKYDVLDMGGTQVVTIAVDFE